MKPTDRHCRLLLSLALLAVQWSQGVLGAGYSTGGDEAECWLTAYIENVSSVSNSVFSNYNSTAMCSAVELDKLLLEDCPSWLNLNLLTDLGDSVTLDKTYQVEYELVTYLEPLLVQARIDGQKHKWRVPEAGLRSCFSSIGFCTPFVDDIVTTSDMTAANTSYLGAGYWYHYANFTSMVELTEEGTYTIIAHAQIQVYIDLNDDGNDELATFDIARAYLAVEATNSGTLVHVHNIERAVAVALVTLSVLICVICAAAVVHYWNHKFMVYGTRRSLVVMTCAGTLACVGVLLFAEVTLTGCNAYNLGVLLPWMSMYFVLFAKVFRVWWIMKGKLQKRVMTERYVLKLALAVVVALMTFFGLWLWLNPSEVVDKDINGSDGRYYEACEGKHDMYFQAVLVTAVCALLIVGAYLARKTWKLQDAFNESRYLAFAVYNCVVLIPLSQGLMRAVDNVRISYLMKVCEICVTVVCTVTIMIVPKVRLIWSRGSDDVGPDGKEKNAQQQFDAEIIEGAVVLRDELSKTIALHQAGYTIPPDRFDKLSEHIERVNRSLNFGHSHEDSQRTMLPAAPRLSTTTNAIAGRLSVFGRRSTGGGRASEQADAAAAAAESLDLNGVELQAAGSASEGDGPTANPGWVRPSQGLLTTRTSRRTPSFLGLQKRGSKAAPADLGQANETPMLAGTQVTEDEGKVAPIGGGVVAASGQKAAL